MRKLTGEKLEQERARLEEMRFFEHRYVSYRAVCGIDEAGRGPLAGPVAAGAVILPKDCEILYLNDSKKLTPKRRELLYDEICEKAVAWGVGLVPAERIDEINILQADYEAMRIAVGKLGVKPDLLLNDAVTIPGIDIPQVPIIKGDAKSVSIAAASILAKVTRDRLMEEYDKLYPEYGFAKHKGYGTAQHIAALRQYGPCPIHRRTFIGHFVPQEALRNPAASKTAGEPAAAGMSGAPAGFEMPGNPAGPEGDGGRGRRNLRRVGADMERAAGEYLEGQGVRILARNYRTRNAEVDLIGQDGNYLVFFEVKYRSSTRMGTPLEAVNAAKRKRISDAARRYLYEHHYPADYPVRFDCIGILGEEITWIRNAFPA